MYKKIAISTLLSLSLLSGCFGAEPEEELYVVFEDAVKQETSLFENAQALAALEQKNVELYERILEGGQDNNEQVQQELEEAVKGISERKRLLDDGKKTLEQAQDKMKEVNRHISKIEDDKLRKQAKKVVSLYEERFNAFVAMQEAYQKALAAEEKLYSILQAKTETMKTIANQIKEVNRLYVELDKNNEIFNTLTKQYNEEKVAFYKQANFRIKEQK